MGDNLTSIVEIITDVVREPFFELRDMERICLEQAEEAGTPEGTAAIEPLSAVRPGLLSLICYCPSRRRC
jgi:hypothetical protein